jgi:predicted DNA-binding transcriptional regulator
MVYPMANDRAIGGAVLGGSVVGIVVYGLIIYFWPLFVLEITAFVAVFAILAILAWIGYTMATTPPPEPMADIPAVSKPDPSSNPTEPLAPEGKNPA